MQEYKGKQSLKKLKESANGNISDIEITDKNIKAFDRYARKYKVDYALKKDKSVDPPRWFSSRLKTLIPCKRLSGSLPPGS